MCEEIERAVVRVVIGRMGDENMRGLEITDDIDEVIEDVFAGVGGARSEGGIVGHGVGACQRRAVRRNGAPVVVPDIERAGIGIAEEDHIIGGQPKLSNGRKGFVLPAQAGGLRRAGHESGVPAGEEGADFVVVAHGEEADPDGQIKGQGFLDETAGGEGFVVGMRSQDQETIVVAEEQGFRGDGRGTGGPAGKQAGRNRDQNGAATCHIRSLRTWFSGRQNRLRPG